MYAVTAEWKHFSSGSHKAGGRLIHAPVPSGDLILYVPGFPGGGATLFENRFADLLRKEEYSQIVLRHNGTILNGKFSDFLLNREQFPHAIPHHDGAYLCGVPSSVAEWLVEPKTVLEDFGANYTNITVIGHSFGAVAALHSLALMAEEGNPLVERVRSCICLAPAVGILKDHEDDVMDTVWATEFLSNPELAEKIALNSPENIRADLIPVYQNLAERVSASLKGIEKFFVHVERDEYLRYEDVDEFAKACGQNTHFVLDRFDRHDPRLPYDAHDMPNYPQQSLLDLIEGNIDPVDTISHSDGFME